MFSSNLDINIRQELAADGSYSGVEAEEYTPYPFDAERISISSKKISLSNLVRRLERGLIRAADIQRRDSIWDISKQSRLIESLMLKIPIPLFYAAADKDDNYIIVDGLQRASTIRRFVLEESFGLKGLEFLHEFVDSKYSALPERMRIRIEETELDFVIINPDSPPGVQRNIFKRLNTGGMPLTEQEIRHALYFGPATDLLKSLVETESFKKATANSINDSRMAAQELVLRFLAFSLKRVDGYRKNDDMDAFLSDTMQEINSNLSTESRARLEHGFILAMDRAAAIFGNCAFRISTPLRVRSGGNRTPINKSLFEVWSVLLAELDNREYEIVKENSEKLFGLLEIEFKKEQLRRYIGQDSAKVASVRARHEIVNDIVMKVEELDYDTKSLIEKF
jgi:hypothetical protein